MNNPTKRYIYKMRVQKVNKTFVQSNNRAARMQILPENGSTGYQIKTQKDEEHILEHIEGQFLEHKHIYKDLSI